MSIWIPDDPLELLGVAVSALPGTPEFDRMVACNQAMVGWLDGTVDEEYFDLLSDCRFDPYEHIADTIAYLNVCQV